MLKIVCSENKFMDDSKAVLKKIISGDISNNYNVDDVDIEVEVDEYLGALNRSASVIVVSSDSD